MTERREIKFALIKRWWNRHSRCKTSTHLLDQEVGGKCEQVQQHPGQHIPAVHIEPC